MNKRKPDSEKPKGATNIKEVLDQMKESNNRTRFQSDQEKSIYEERINQKVQSGAKLTVSEMNYIRETNPQLYIKVVRIQMRRDMMEQKLKNCKSKKEVEDAVSFEIGCISEKDPDREPLIKAIQNITSEFKKTVEYKNLPEVEKENKEDNKETDQEDIINYSGFDMKM
jgi:hypothetical protein